MAPRYSGFMSKGKDRLNKAGGAWLFTDERVPDAQLMRAAQRLKRGDGIILRHYRLSEAERLLLLTKLRKIAQRRGVRLLLAAPVGQAFPACDGWHGKLMSARHNGQTGLRTMPVHNTSELQMARRMKADCVFISPVFKTRSHAGKRPLGMLKYCTIAAQARGGGIAPLALGGMNKARFALMRGRLCRGYGAIDALTDQL